MTFARLNTYIGSLTFLVIALAALNWNVAPETATAGIAAVVTMFFIWGVVGVKTKLAPRVKLGTAERKFFNAAVILAGLLLAFSLTAKLVGILLDIEPSIIERARNVFSGFVLLYFANMMPKMIGPAFKGKCSNTAANSARRFSGWVLAIGALGYIGAWIFAPIEQTSAIAHGFVGVAVVLVVLRLGYAFLGERRAGV